MHPDTSQVLELRQYTLHPGKRDVLVEMFDRLFVDPQEQLGMRVLGQFRDVDAPDRFVWLRGFPDLASRAGLLAAFYGGPIWKANRDAANDTMIDSDDILLLRPVDAGSGLHLPAMRTATAAAAEASGGFVMVTVYLLRAAVDDEFLRLFDTRVSPLVAAAGGPPLARYRTEYGRNDFPRLPVREGEHAFVWITSFAGPAEYRRYREALERSEAPAIGAYLKSAPQELHLSPTSRSLFRHAEPSGFTTRRTGSVGDFDFIAGDWSIVSRRLATRGPGSSDWEEFQGTGRASVHLGGVANVDEITFPTRGLAGMTVRSFDASTRQWTLRWINARTGTMDPGVVGGFAGDRGEFYGEDDERGQRVKVRYVWTKLGAGAARWEQAFSYAGGPWETNWIMTFTRR